MQRASERYAAVPRTFDPLLERKARGDRGCLFDLGSGLGILTTFGCLIASQMGLIAFRWVYLGVGIWIVSYFLGASAQGRSAKARRHALEHGPLAPACLIACEPHLRESSNRRSGRALVVFALGGELSVGERLRHAAGVLGKPLPEGAMGPEVDALRKLLGDEFCFDFVALDAKLLEAIGVPESGETGLYATRVVIDPEQLHDGALESGAELAVIAHLESGIAEMV